MSSHRELVARDKIRGKKMSIAYAILYYVSVVIWTDTYRTGMEYSKSNGYNLYYTLDPFARLK